MVVKMRYDFFFFLVAFIFWFAVETLATALVLPCVSRRERESETAEDGIDRSTNSILSHLSPFTIYSLLHHSVCSPTPDSSPPRYRVLLLHPRLLFSLSLSLFPYFFSFSPFPVCFVSSMSLSLCLLPPPFPTASMASRRRSTWPGALSGSYVEKEENLLSFHGAGWLAGGDSYQIVKKKNSNFIYWKWKMSLLAVEMGLDSRLKCLTISWTLKQD